MQPNPYTPGGRPRVFVGRDAERAQLRDRLARVIAFGEMAGPLLVVTGPRGLGKTSLLRDIADQAAADGFVVAWVAGVKRRPILRDVLQSVTGALERADVLAEPRTRSRIKEYEVQLHFGVGRVGAKFEPQGTTDAPPLSQYAVEAFFETASNAVRERGGAGLLVLIDELHAPVEPRSTRDSTADPEAQYEIALLLNVIQNMDAQRERFPLAVIGAGLPQTMGLLTRAATFGERAHEIVLAEFDERTSQEALTEPAAQLGVRWEPDAVADAVESAAGYPQALQIVGSAVWEAARPERDGRITAEHVVASAAAFEQRVSTMFHTRWDVASPAERAFLRAMAEVDEPVVHRRDLADRLGVTSDELSVPRRSLITKGIIEAAGHGKMRFTIPGFGAFVRDRDGE